MYYHYKKYFKKCLLRSRSRNVLYSKLIDKVENVLEFGVGNGYFMDYCNQNNIVYIGIDYSDIIFKNRENIIKADIPNDFYNIKGKYDLIFAEHFVEHLQNYETVIKFLIECRKRINMNGKIILLYPNVNNIGRIFYHDPTHEYITNIYRIEKCLIDSGYQVIKSGNYMLCFTGIIARVLSLIHYLPMPLNLKLNFLLHSYTIARR